MQRSRAWSRGPEVVQMQLITVSHWWSRYECVMGSREALVVPSYQTLGMAVMGVLPRPRAGIHRLSRTSRPRRIT
jgi:hypothetical protein